MAPEILSNSIYTTKADIYSFALIMWEIIFQKPFFDDAKFDYEIEKKVVNNERPPLHGCHTDVKKIISSCWHPDPEQRPSAALVVSLVTSLEPEQLSVTVP